MSDEDQRLGAVRDGLLERYLDFAFGGLHFEARDLSAEIAEARQKLTDFLGREPWFPDRPSRLIHLALVTDDTDEIVGKATREVGVRGTALVVAHKALHIWPAQWRRRGFGSALLAENRDWYRECGVAFIVMEAEGDGSAFAALRGFDFDLSAYARRPGFAGLTERELRLAAVDRLIHHPAIQESVDAAQPPHRESAADFLDRVEAGSADAAEQVRRFRRRLPRPLSGEPGRLAGDPLTFTAPDEIAAFGRDEPRDGPGGRRLGLEVLALTGWSGITPVGEQVPARDPRAVGP